MWWRVYCAMNPKRHYRIGKLKLDTEHLRLHGSNVHYDMSLASVGFASTWLPTRKPTFSAPPWKSAGRPSAVARFSPSSRS